MNEQTKAQRLADEFENGVVVAHTNQWKGEAAVELRRLDALNAELVEALEQVMLWIENWSPEFSYDPDWPFDRDAALAALAKAKEKT